MHRVIYAVVVVVCSLSLSAAPREGRESLDSRDRASPIVKAVRRVIRALGDGLTIPGSNPVPNPAPKP